MVSDWRVMMSFVSCEPIIARHFVARDQNIPCDPEESKVQIFPFCLFTSHSDIPSTYCKVVYIYYVYITFLILSHCVKYLLSFHHWSNIKRSNNRSRQVLHINCFLRDDHCWVMSGKWKIKFFFASLFSMMGEVFWK